MDAQKFVRRSLVLDRGLDADLRVIQEASGASLSAIVRELLGDPARMIADALDDLRTADSEGAARAAIGSRVDLAVSSALSNYNKARESL